MHACVLKKRQKERKRKRQYALIMIIKRGETHLHNHYLNIYKPNFHDLSFFFFFGRLFYSLFNRRAFAWGNTMSFSFIRISWLPKFLAQIRHIIIIIINEMRMRILIPETKKHIEINIQLTEMDGILISCIQSYLYKDVPVSS